LEHPSHDEDESIEIGSGTRASSAVDNATICLSNTQISHASALNSSAETEDALHLTDDVFEQSSLSQRMLNLTDTVRRYTRNCTLQHDEDGEWVYASSGSESPRSPNDNIADDNNLSDGELELGEAVISVNQYIVQPMGAHTDVSFSSAGDLDTNEIFRLVDQSFNPFSLDRNNTTVIASNVHTFAERDWDQGTLDVLQSGTESGTESGAMTAITEEESARNSTRVLTTHSPVSTARKNRRPRDSNSFILPRLGHFRRSISPPRAQAPLPAAAPLQQTSTFPWLALDLKAAAVARLTNSRLFLTIAAAHSSPTSTWTFKTRRWRLAAAENLAAFARERR